MASKILEFWCDTGDEVYVIKNDNCEFVVYGAGEFVIATCAKFDDAYNVFCANMREMREKVLRREMGV